jgi:hypothetical protein
MSRQWVDFSLALPSGASVEIDIDDDTGTLRAEIELHCDAERLTLLADALRSAVVEVDAQRARLDMPESDIAGMAAALATKARKR